MAINESNNHFLS